MLNDNGMHDNKELVKQLREALNELMKSSYEQNQIGLRNGTVDVYCENYVWLQICEEHCDKHCVVYYNLYYHLNGKAHKHVEMEKEGMIDYLENLIRKLGEITE